jgi:hypothetical protein
MTKIYPTLYQMMRFLILMSLVVLTKTPLAQFSEGYIVTNNGDTLYGKIKDRTTGFNTRIYPKVRFRQPGKPQKRFRPRHIKAYYSEGSGLFESQWFDRQPRLLKNDYVNVTGMGQKHFMKVIVRGKLSLYHLEFRDADNAAVDYIEFFKMEGDHRFVRASQGLLGLKKKLLLEYFKDYPAVTEQIQSGALKTAVDVAIYFNSHYAKG